MGAEAGQGSTYAIVAEAPDMAAGIERVLDIAFGPGRFAKTSERVRERGAALRRDLSRVALEGASPIGVCRIHEIEVGDRPALFLGPLGVAPASRHAGLGRELVAAAIEASKPEKKPLIVVGAHAFFAQFGFMPIPDNRVRMPGPIDRQRLLWLAMVPGLLDGLAGEVTAPRAANPT